MNLYLDDDTAKKALVRRLVKAGHRTATPGDVGSAGASDATHLTLAIRRRLVLLSRNYKDFLELHDLVKAASGSHFGLLLVRADNDLSRDMKDADIARAISNLEQAGVPIADELHVLNHWR